MSPKPATTTLDLDWVPLAFPVPVEGDYKYAIELMLNSAAKGATQRQCCIDFDLWQQHQSSMGGRGVAFHRLARCGVGLRLYRTRQGDERPTPPADCRSVFGGTANALGRHEAATVVHAVASSADNG